MRFARAMWTRVALYILYLSLTPRISFATVDYPRRRRERAIIPIVATIAVNKQLFPSRDA